MTETTPEMEKYKLVLTQFKGKRKALVIHKSNESNALVAIANIMALSGNENVNPKDVGQAMDLEMYKKEVVDAVNETIDDLPPGSDRRKQLMGKKEIFEQIVSSLDSPTVLDPVNTRCDNFVETDEYLLFETLLGIKLLHGWVLDEKKQDLSFAKGISHSMFSEIIAAAEQTKSGDALIKELNDFMNACITTQGLSHMHDVVKEGDLAVLYAKNHYSILHKHNGDLFTLETDEEIMKRLPNAVWKKLSVEVERSFHVTSQFAPTNGQQKEKQKLADEWFVGKLATDKPTSRKKSKSKKGKLAKESGYKDATFESVLPISDMCPPENVSTSKEPTTPTIAEEEPTPKEPDMEEQYKLVLTQFKGKRKAFVSHRSNESNALVAIANFMALSGDENVNPKDVGQVMDLEKFKKEVVDAVNETIDDLSPGSDRRKQLMGKKEIFEQIVSSLDSPTVLDPVNTRCDNFVETDEYLLFETLLGIKLLHGWVLDEKKQDLSFAKGISHSMFSEIIAAAEQTKSGDALIKELNDFMNACITTQGLSHMHAVVKEGDLAVLYAKNHYSILHKHNGDLFTLETDEEIMKRLPNAVWKKLSVEVERSFHVTSQFAPTNGQQKEKQKLADEWFVGKLATDKPTSRKKSKSKKGKLAKESGYKDATFESGLPISDVLVSEESRSNRQKPQSICTYTDHSMLTPQSMHRLYKENLSVSKS